MQMNNFLPVQCRLLVKSIVESVRKRLLWLPVEIQPCCHNGQELLLFCDWIIFNICEISLLHSSVGRQLGCYHVLATGNSAEVKLWVQIYLKIVIWFPSDKYPEVRLLSHMVVLFQNLEEPAPCFPYWLYQFIFPPSIPLFFSFL